MVRQKMRLLWITCLAVSLLNAARPAMAADKTALAPRVRLGPVYRIAEPDMLEELQSKLKGMQADGTLKRMQDEATRRAIQSVARPTGLSLPRAVHARAWLHDPTYVVPSDIADHQGRVFAYAGDRINPLEKGIGLRHPLLFLDADDSTQLKALPELMARLDTPKIILVAGDWRATSEQVKRPVFFDQRASLVRTFGISALPAVVEQAGTQLKVTEIVLKDGP